MVRRFKRHSLSWWSLLSKRIGSNLEGGDYKHARENEKPRYGVEASLPDSLVARFTGAWGPSTGSSEPQARVLKNVRPCILSRTQRTDHVGSPRGRVRHPQRSSLS